MTNKIDFDSIQRFIFEACDIRGEIISLDKSFQNSTRHQDLSEAHASLLGEFYAATVLLSNSLKFDGLLTLQARGDGVIPLIMAEANNNHDFRGILKENASAAGKPPYAPGLSELLGNAVLSLTMDPARGERYQGIVALEEKTLAECLNVYFSHSEQLATHFTLFSNAEYCGGILLQALPKGKITEQKSTDDFWETSVQLVSTLKAEELYSLNHDELLFRLFHQLDCKLFPSQEVNFKCSCSFDRSANAIVSLGKSEAFELLNESEGEIKTNCEFCGKTYSFGRKDLTTLFGEPKTPPH